LRKLVDRPSLFPCSRAADRTFSSVVEVSRALGTEVVLVPIRLMTAVNQLLDEHEPNPTGLSRRKLVGNDPEDAEDGDECDE
jgi:hypothetical protein